MTTETTAVEQRAMAKAKVQEWLEIVQKSIRGEDGASWSLVRDAEGVKVFNCYPSGTSVPRWKCVGEISGIDGRELNERVLIGGENREKWNPTSAGSKVFDQWVEDGRSYRIYNDWNAGALGGLISPRDFCEVSAIWTEEIPGETGKTRSWFIFGSIADSRCPPRSGYTRGTVHPSGYLIEQDSPKHCSVKTITQVDLAGSLPGFLVNRAFPGELSVFFVACNKIYGPKK